MELMDFRNVPKNFTNILAKLTPVETHDGIKVKRDDLFELGGARGGKARTCYYLGHGASGLVTAGSRVSPQILITAYVSKYFDIPCRCHTPSGEMTNELKLAEKLGAEIIQHHPGYNSVIVARAKRDAETLRWREIPFGMECQEAVRQTMNQVYNIPKDTKRIVMSVGSGMSLSGVLWGLKKRELKIPVLGVVVGANPYKRLDAYAPKEWKHMVSLVSSEFDYHKSPETVKLKGISLDPIYEAKTIPFIKDGDLLWIIGHRGNIKEENDGKKENKIGR
jgi:1-aminocyclopropane-1-carboxylate deaminase/D-cysteine desulfhydrase-like pyridoxal-dependent ACC family enzyme